MPQVNDEKIRGTNKGICGKPSNCGERCRIFGASCNDSCKEESN